MWYLGAVPRHPDISGPAGAMPASIFARLMERLSRYKGEVYPFHLGDTHLNPPDPALLEAIDWRSVATRGLYTYSAPAGDSELVDAVVAKLAAKNGLEVKPSNVQITAGATHGFSCAARAVLDAGDEVLVLAPYWPLIRGHIISVGARPVEVPLSTVLYRDPDADVRAILDEFVTPKTSALYLINPNNPDGKVFTRAQLEAIADVARRHDLWVLADEVYEEFAFDGRTHVSIATLEGMAARTVTVFSFSKSYAQAGLRVGYVVGPESVVVPIGKLANHSIYSVPRAMQRSALAALHGGETFLAQAREHYRAARDETVRALSGHALQTPEGGSYVFIDLATYLSGAETAVDLLERLAAEGILLAPGSAFGRAFGTWARLCYTAVPMGRLSSGLSKMAALLG
jgi:aspartate/methionine/tyrosine aminotransferase